MSAKKHNLESPNKQKKRSKTHSHAPAKRRLAHTHARTDIEIEIDVLVGWRGEGAHSTIYLSLASDNVHDISFMRDI